MTCSTPDFPVLHYLPELAKIHIHWFRDAIQPSHHPLLLLPSIFPSIRAFSNELALLQYSGASSSASVFPTNILGWGLKGLEEWTQIGIWELLKSSLNKWSSVSIRQESAQIESREAVFLSVVSGAARSESEWETSLMAMNSGSTAKHSQPIRGMHSRVRTTMNSEKWKVKVKSLSRVQLCDPVDCSPPGSSVHGILQARILKWVAISFSRGSSQPSDRTRVSCIAGRHFILWATNSESTAKHSQPIRGIHSRVRTTIWLNAGGGASACLPARVCIDDLWGRKSRGIWQEKKVFRSGQK